MAFKKGYKQTQEYKRKIGIANAISLKGKKQSIKQIENRSKGKRSNSFFYL